MSATNDTTIQTYATHLDEYVAGTPQTVDGPLQDWIDAAISELPTDASILELGSGFGRDAQYIQTHGYSVHCSDAVEGFVSLLQQKGLDAQKLDAIADPLPGTYDLVFADAVLLHFTRSDTALLLKKVHAALTTNGRFAFSVKRGDGEEWSDEKLGAPRFFCYWTPAQISELLANCGYRSHEMVGNGVGHNGAQWLRIIARK
jgi:SAM-dependent methyltransferase